MNSVKSNSLLWELLAPDGVKSSYLFGTIHLPDTTLFERIPQVKRLIDSSDIFMAEYDLDIQPGNGPSPFLINHPKGIINYISEQKFEKLRKQFLKSFGIDLKYYANMKPFLLDQLIAEKLVSNRTTDPMDILLWKYAKENSKVLVGAESFECQLAIMEKFPIDQQIKNLLRNGRSPWRIRRGIYRIMDYYRKENIRALYKYSMSSLGKMKSVLVYERNKNIVESIKNHSDGASLVCAVGAGHLYGYQGLLRLMKKEGYKLKPIHP